MSRMECDDPSVIWEAGRGMTGVCATPPQWDPSALLAAIIAGLILVAIVCEIIVHGPF